MGLRWMEQFELRDRGDHQSKSESAFKCHHWHPTRHCLLSPCQHLLPSCHVSQRNDDQ